MTEKQRPADTLRQGPLKATIWKNESENGPLFNTTISRTYQDKEGVWQETSTMREKDLLPMGELGRTAFQRVNELKQGHYRGQEPDRSAHREKRQQQAPSNRRGPER